MKLPQLSFDLARFSAGRQPPGFNADNITATIERALAGAGLDTGCGTMKGVSETIRQALSSAGMRFKPMAGEDVIDIVARPVGMPPSPVEGKRSPSIREDREADPGEFLARSYTNHAGTRAYKLYVPSSRAGEAMPLVVMLHGCTQGPDDFAAGTRMNALAERHGFLVVYPAQAPNANGSKCWNWFKSQDQARDSGEPSIIAGIARQVAADYRVEPGRIFVAGLSAGAAMAVILGETYPELFAGVGAHSGLPYGAAHDMPSAFAAMKGGATAARRAKASPPVPTIVFHGDRDPTVDARNGAAIAEEAIARASSSREDGDPMRASVQPGIAAGGSRYRRTVHADASDRPLVEHWVVHGAGHAWSGGSASGSYTDVAGPDASAEMVRFFYAQQRPDPS